MRQPLCENNSYEGVVEVHSPYVLVEGVLEKSKLKKESFLRLSLGRSRSRWVPRYFVLRCSEVPDSFYLDQYSDETPTSRVRKTLDMERVSQVDTNVMSRDDDKKWIFSVHFFGVRGHSSKEGALYLAAHSETEMNKWVAQLCYACNLEKQEENEPYLQAPRLASPAGPVRSSGERPGTSHDGDFFGESFDSFVETPSSAGSIPDRFFSEQTNPKPVGDYTPLKYCGSDLAITPQAIPSTADDQTAAASTTQPYIHLKHCTSSHQNSESSSCGHQRNCSVGGCSATSSEATSSTDSECLAGDVPCRSSLDSIPPPPRPPKSQFSSLSRNEREKVSETYANSNYWLNQALPPPDLDEIGIDDCQGWSGETIRAFEVSERASSSDDRLSLKELIGATGPNVFAPCDPLLVPPKVDRTCKPVRRDPTTDDDNRGTNYTNVVPSPPPPRQSTSMTKSKLPVIPRTNPLNRVHRDNSNAPTSLPKGGLRENSTNPHLSPPPSATSVLEYFDPAEGRTVLRSTSASFTPPTPTSLHPDVPPKTVPTVEYTVIDEASTKAVFEANIRQNELRAMRTSKSALT